MTGGLTPLLENAAPSSCSVPTLYAAMCASQSERLERQAVVLNERVLGKRRDRPPRGRFRELTAVEFRPLQEECGDGSRNVPRFLQSAMVQVGAVGARRGEQLDSLESRQIPNQCAPIVPGQI